MKSFQGQQGFTLVEMLFTLCILGLLIGVVIPRYQKVAVEAQKAALKTGLSNIRTSIKLFKMLNGRSPHDLNELMEKEVMLPARIGKNSYTGSLFLNHKYLISQAKDLDGNIIDAFGNQYLYNAEGGDVRSSTKGYEAL